MKLQLENEKGYKDYLKMKNLGDILMNPQKGIPWSTLEKYEQVLQCLDKYTEPTAKVSIFQTIRNGYTYVYDSF